MTEYQSFLGIDIGKFNFVVAVYGQQNTQEYQNTENGIEQFIIDHKVILTNTLVIVETTGGYELNLLYALYQLKYAVHRADSCKVKRFIQSLGNTAKTDVLDAKALAYYGKERSNVLPLFAPQSEQEIDLFQLVQRRIDLSKALIAEKNRLQSPTISTKVVRNSCKTMINAITKQIAIITEQAKDMIKANTILRKKHQILKTIPGIGDIIALELLVLLPELGKKTTRKKIASLAGVAPKARESGKFKGYRRTGYGRGGVKPILFLAAMAARNSNSHLKQYYERLIARGKRKMVALTALMRKIIVIANAKIRDFENPISC